jgi:hypothetical protein
VFDLLSNRELNSGQINDLLELLERELAGVLDGGYLIAPTELSVLISYSQKNHTKQAYQKQQGQLSVEEELLQQCHSTIASVTWILVGGCSHWISYTVS